MDRCKYRSTIIREGDIVLVDGEIHEIEVPFFKTEGYAMWAKHVYNETLKCGF